MAIIHGGGRALHSAADVVYNFSQLRSQADNNEHAALYVEFVSMNTEYNDGVLYLRTQPAVRRSADRTSIHLWVVRTTGRRALCLG